MDEHYSDALPPPRPEPSQEHLLAAKDLPLFPVLQLIRRRPPTNIQNSHMTLREVGELTLVGAALGGIIGLAVALFAFAVSMATSPKLVMGLPLLVVFPVGFALAVGLGWGALALGFFGLDTFERVVVRSLWGRPAPSDDALLSETKDEEKNTDISDTLFRDRRHP